MQILTFPTFSRHIPPFPAFLSYLVCLHKVCKNFGGAGTILLRRIHMESSNGHFGEWKAHQLKEAACSSFGIDDSGGVYSTLLGMFLEQILSLTAQADSLEK